MTTSTLPLLLLAALVVCGHSQSYYYDEDDYDAFTLDQMTAYDKEVTDFLGNKILRGIDSSQYCDDPYAAFCGSKAKNRTRPIHMKQAYRNIRTYLINVLRQPIVINEVTSLSVEKTMFRRCMNLGLRNDTANRRATENFVTDLFQNLFSTGNVSWQSVDKQLHSKGFDLTFFDIKVERDPMNPRQNIIVIEPPSWPRIDSLYEWMKMVFDPRDPPDQTQIPWKFFDIIDLVPVKKLFNRWLEIVSQSSRQRKQERRSLKDWNEEYESKSAFKPPHTKIDWEKLIIDTFIRVHINVKGTENIIVRNKDYFFSLIDLLNEQTSNDVIVLAIKAKIILENIRHVDYNYADILYHRKKSLFCYENTNLYGASYRLLRDFKRDESNDEEHYEILNEMLLSISDILIFNIDESNNLTPKEKRYLVAQVKLITSHVVKYKNCRDIADDYYEEYETSPSYFVSILNYRKMLKDKEYSSLTVHLEHLIESEPFSVIDLAKPRNRFILYVLASSFLLSKQPIPFELQKEVHYGIYGVSIASFLYGLLNENGFDREVDLTGRVDWFDHPIYPYNSMQCFVGEDVRTYGWRLASEAVSQIFGARIAYNALLEDYEESELIRPKEFLIVNLNSDLETLESDKLFFMSYGKYQCHLGQKLLKTILLNLSEYQNTFKCGPMRGELKLQCPLNAFQLQGKHHFVDKPF